MEHYTFWQINKQRQLAIAIKRLILYKERFNALDIILASLIISLIDYCFGWNFNFQLKFA